MGELRLVAELKKDQACLEALSKVYWNSPTHAVLAGLLDVLSLLDSKNPEMSHGIDLVRKSIRNPIEQTLRDLVVDYAGIFIGHHVQDPFPYESVYTSEKRLMMQEARDDVLAAYREANFEVPFGGTDNEPEDHLAIELAFEADLCRRAAEAFEAGEIEGATRLMEIKDSFRKEHLNNWVPTLCADIQKKAETDFFKGIAIITAAYVG